MPQPARMKAIDKILVVLDKSERDKRVIARAQRLAACFGSRLELFLCDAEHEYAFRHNFDDRGNTAARERCLADALAYLRSVKEALPIEQSAIEVEASCESPLYEGIVHRARASRPDLVLKSSSCDRSDCANSFGDSDWMLASTCPGAVMFVGAREWSKAPRVAAAIDASSHERPGLARSILDMADSLRARTEGQLEVIACVPESSQEAGQHAYARRFEDLVSKLKLTGEHAHLLRGDPERVLPQFASTRSYDIFVMGALAHRVAPAPMVGSLTGKLVDALDCDFLLMKADTLALRPATGG